MYIQMYNALLVQYTVMYFQHLAPWAQTF